MPVRQLVPDSVAMPDGIQIIGIETRKEGQQTEWGDLFTQPDPPVKNIQRQGQDTDQTRIDIRKSVADQGFILMRWRVMNSRTVNSDMIRKTVARRRGHLQSHPGR